MGCLRSFRPLTLRRYDISFCNRPVTSSLDYSSDLPVLVVPDVHQDLGFLERAVALARQEGASLVFLGDYVDTIDPRWCGESALRAVAKALPEIAETHPHGCLFLAGNHDVMALQIAYSRARQLLSGDPARLAPVRDARQPDANYAALLGAWPQTFLKTWRLAAVCHGFMLSHAGVARRFWLWDADTDTAGQTSAFVAQSTRAWLDWLEQGVESPLFAVGPARGGQLSPLGGPLWLDWDDEFVDDLALPQLVGHTRGREPRRKHRSWCLDASQSCAGLLDPALGLRVVKV
jgi:Calcineurin-like phosphoesterase